MFLCILISGLIVGVVIGLIVVLLQFWFVQLVLLYVEFYEFGQLIYNGVQVVSVYQLLGDFEWMCNLLLVLFIMLIYVGYGLMLIVFLVVVEVCGYVVMVQQGLIWGIVGFVIMQFVFVFGFVFEVLGVVVVDVGQWVIWWLGMVVVIGVVLWLIVFGCSVLIWGVVVVLIFVLYVIGVLQFDVYVGIVLFEFFVEFVGWVFGIGLMVWVMLGLVVVWFWQCDIVYVVLLQIV